ncbi:NAD(P)-dependent dehydrogenase, short-chain alcohol dehydrogenase family [Nonomuraea solani]|uniref:NAD(P)-dependent dehydrogenase, short-chain alcohol dehydrogenase family n=1 Tax=Nonomuraea solani TaxID=1144553 RepID=A0A1H6EIM9_9ACTN|nr:SDR family NAD(P)-dependent oxidoreductase [Nonomuraea solani]SEG97153.1 NAD(P)-dependent dehydrogenase, short-chain alcohol dehydrogenase family [Nonomuraea solani]
MRPMEQRTILVTGATDGLGRALAADLAGRGATVLVHGRDDGRGQDTLDEIRARVPGARLHWYRADLASLGEVRELAAAVAGEHPGLDTLVNNAGIGATVPGGEGRQESADGHELRFAVNYLAGYLLTRLLLPVLRAAAPSRIVNVSSLGQAPIDFDDVMLVKEYSGVRAYCQSKLAQVMFTVDLAEELAGTGVTANALHPATYMPTKMVVAAPASELREGVEATSRLVTDPELDEVSGRFFDGTRPAQALEQGYDPGARARLRKLSESLTG